MRPSGPEGCDAVQVEEYSREPRLQVRGDLAVRSAKVGVLNSEHCHLRQSSVHSADPPNGRASRGVFLYAGSTCRSKSYSRYTMSPCWTPAVVSARALLARSVNCSGSRLVSCAFMRRHRHSQVQQEHINMLICSYCSLSRD